MRKIEISAGAVFLLSLLYFFSDFETGAAIFTAVAVHELGHIALIKLCGGSAMGLRMSVSGFCISYTGLYGAGELFALLAGPAAGIILAYAASFFGNRYLNFYLLKTAGFSLILSLYNLLPALPLDGGRALALILSGCLGDTTAARIAEILSFLTGLGMLAAGLMLLKDRFGMALFAAGIIILFKQVL